MSTDRWYSRAWRRVRGQSPTPPRQLAAAPRAPTPTSTQFGWSASLDRLSVLTSTELSLQSLLSAFRAADYGVPAQQCDIFEKRIQMDSHLRAILDERREAVARKPWAIQEGGESDADKAAAMVLERAIRRVPSFVATLEHQLTANPYGYGLSEIDWQLVDGWVVPVRFLDAPHRRFTFGDEDRPVLTASSSDYAGTQLIPGKWWYTRRSGRLAAASGLMRTAAIWSYFKSRSVSDWLVFADRFGIPYVTGQYDQDAPDEDKTILGQAVAALGTDGYATFSKACEIAITQPAGGSSSAVHPDIIGLCNAEMSKLIAGATLLTEPGGSGSYAMATVHQGRGFELKRGDAEWIAASFEECVGRPFCEFNGLDARAPRLQLYLQLDVSTKEQIEIASACANELGLAIDEDQIRRITMLQRPTGAALYGTRGAPAKEENGDKAA